jgi:hypothetical protein
LQAIANSPKFFHHLPSFPAPNLRNSLPLPCEPQQDTFILSSAYSYLSLLTAFANKTVIASLDRHILSFSRILPTMLRAIRQQSRGSLLYILIKLIFSMIETRQATTTCLTNYTTNGKKAALMKNTLAKQQG